MSTPSLIGVLQPGSQVRYIYSHSNGNHTYTGALLHQHYSSPHMVEALLELGDLSIVGPRIGRKTNFDKPAKGQCLAYIRDRGEPLDRCSPRLCPDQERYFALIYQEQIPYLYLWIGDQWRTASNQDWYTQLRHTHPDPRPYLASTSPWQSLETVLLLAKGETPPPPAARGQLPTNDPESQIRLF